MKRKMKVWYDKEGDFLEVKFGPTTGITRAIGGECFELLNKEHKVVGYAIFNFTKRFGQNKDIVLTVPAQ